MTPQTLKRRNSSFVEILRLLVVVFGAAAGYEIGQGVTDQSDLLGPLDAVAVGVILGSALGYVIGGVIGRTTSLAVESSTHRLRDVSAEQLVAGGIGAAVGALIGAAVAWPLFFIPSAYFAIPLFAFVIATLGLLGYRLAATRRHSVLSIIGSSRGRDQRPVPVAARERLIDASVAVDGRLLDVVRSGFLAGPLLLPGPVLLQIETDAAGTDLVIAARARRALMVLDQLRREPDIDLEVIDMEGEPSAVLLRLAVERGAALLTADTQLAKAGRLAGAGVQDLNSLAVALRPQIASGDDVDVVLVRAGKEPQQAVGFLDDGTMVVAESAKDLIGQEATVRVASVLLAEKGRIVFGHPLPPR